MSWKKSIRTVDSEPVKSWRDSIQSIEEAPSDLESLLRGVASGASFGFADEITGGLESLITDKSYEQSRDESRQAYSRAQEENPLVYGAGELGGAIGTAFIPGLGALNAAKGASLATKVSLGAVQGALSGAGLSNEESVSGVVKDVAIGGALGGAMPIAFGGLGRAGNYIAGKTKPLLDEVDNVTNSALKKIGRAGANIPEEYTEKYLKNPDVVNKAMSKEELARKLFDPEYGYLKELSDHTGDLDSQAWETLSKTTNIKKSDLLDSISDTVKKEILNNGDNLSRTDGFGASHLKLKAIDDELNKINSSFGGYISESDLKAIVQDLRAVAYSYEGSPKYTHQGDGLRKLAGHFDDVLKSNSKYQDAMVPVSENTRLIKDVERNFVNRQDPDSYDKFLSKLKRWNGADDSSAMKKTIKHIDSVVEGSFEDAINNSLAKEAFSKADTNGSRKTLLGTVIGGGAGSLLGGPVGGVVGGMIGGAAGQAGDKYAGLIFKKVLDGKIASDEALNHLAPKLGKYADVLKKAASRGNKSLAATHFLLSQRDPEYRKQIESIEKE